MRTQPSGRIPLALALAALSLAAGGCVASERARYDRHLSAVVPRDAARSDDVAITFGLDEYRAPPLARRPGSSPPR